MTVNDRSVAVDPDFRLPLDPPDGMGIVTPTCRDRSEVLFIPVRIGVGLRIGGEARLCFTCGPDGSFYHPSRCACSYGLMSQDECGCTSPLVYTMSDVRAFAALAPSLPMYGS